jgi:uncharacterized membrane protein YccC
VSSGEWLRITYGIALLVLVAVGVGGYLEANAAPTDAVTLSVLGALGVGAGFWAWAEWRSRHG